MRKLEMKGIAVVVCFFFETERQVFFFCFCFFFCYYKFCWPMLTTILSFLICQIAKQKIFFLVSVLFSVSWKDFFLAFFLFILSSFRFFYRCHHYFFCSVSSFFFFFLNEGLAKMRNFFFLKLFNVYSKW